MNTQTTRRALIGGSGLMSVALIAPALAIPADHGSIAFRALLDASETARDHFNNLPVDYEFTDAAQHENEMIKLADATHNADRAIPTNWQEYTRLIEHMSDGGVSAIDDDNATRLLDHARRLSKEGR
jgi:hypothetical protein